MQARHLRVHLTFSDGTADSQALAGEPAEVSIFADFSVVGVPLASDPLHRHVR